MFFWAKKRGIKLHFIQPGKPAQNAFVESFNGKFREYCLGLNHVRPHRSLGRKPPAVFAEDAA